MCFFYSDATASSKSSIETWTIFSNELIEIKNYMKTILNRQDTN